VRLRNDLLQLT